jgi:hypothetical protein
MCVKTGGHRTGVISGIVNRSDDHVVSEESN